MCLNYPFYNLVLTFHLWKETSKRKISSSKIPSRNSNYPSKLSLPNNLYPNLLVIIRLEIRTFYRVMTKHATRWYSIRRSIRMNPFRKKLSASKLSRKVTSQKFLKLNLSRTPTKLNHQQNMLIMLNSTSTIVSIHNLTWPIHKFQKTSNSKN